ncbi:MAG: pilus assembly protein PilM, partial [Planctomycetota bacterium]
SAPGGGKKFTVALDKLLKLGTAKATEFKHQRARLYPEGAQLPSKQELQFQGALKEGAENIAGAIRSSIMFCRTQAKLPKLEYNRVILSGGGARLNGLREYLEKKIGRPVQVLDLSSNLDMRKVDAASARCFEGEVPDMAVALGLAIVDADPQSVHFAMLPEKLIKQRRFWQKTIFGIAAAVVLMLGLILPWQHAREAVLLAAERADMFEGYKQEAKLQKEEFQKSLLANQSLDKKADYYARLTRMGRTYLRLLSALRGMENPGDVPRDIMYTYLGPGKEGEGAAGGPAGGTWDAADEPIREFIAKGYYTINTYPGAKFNDEWEKTVRKKLLEVPGVRIVQMETVPEDERAPRPDTKLFQFRIYLQDDKKPPKLFGAAPPPAKKAAAPQAAPGPLKLAPK